MCLRAQRTLRAESRCEQLGARVPLKREVQEKKAGA